MYSFSKDSWHYRLAGYSNSYYIPTNLCPYVWRVLFGVVLLSSATLIVAAFLLFNILGIISAFQGIWWVDSSIYAFTNCITLLVLLCCSFLLVMDWLCAITDNRANSPPGLFTVYWRSFHDKICPQLTFTDKK